MLQRTIKLPPYPQGFHLITDHIVHALPELSSFQTGLLHLFIQHTSAGLCLNENADPTVRTDMQKFFKELCDHKSYFEHTYEGDDDMPAHIKSALTGSSLSIPISNGRLLLGTWQGIYLGEFRHHGDTRKLIATIQGN